MKVLITGSRGFIGQHLVRALVERGDTVMNLHHECLLDYAALSADLEFNPDYILHLAAYGNMANQDEIDEIFDANLQGIYTLLRATPDIPYKAFVNVSTSSVLLPHQTMYSATKMGAEYLCRAFVDEYNKPIVNFRPYSVYGPGEASFRFIPTVFRSCILGEEMKLVPDSVHDWVYVADVVANMIEVADRRADGEEITLAECGTGIAMRNIDIVKLVEKITKKKSNYTVVDTPLRSFDTGNWVCKRPLPKFTDIENGLTKYYESIT